MTRKKAQPFKPAVVGGKDKEAEDAAMAKAEEMYRAACKGEVLEIIGHLTAEAEAGNVEGIMVITTPFRDNQSDKFLAYRNSGVDSNLMLWCGIMGILAARVQQDAIENGRIPDDEIDPTSLH